MNKPTLLIAAAIIAPAIYDFYRGYHEPRSMLSGLVWPLGGLVVLAIFWRYIPAANIQEQTEEFKTAHCRKFDTGSV